MTQPAQRTRNAGSESSPDGSAPKVASLWRREAGAVVRLATPVVLVQLGMMLLGVVDTMMLGRVSGHAIAAGSLGNTVTFGVGIFALGVIMALDPLVAQAFGAGQHDDVRLHFERGVVLALFLCLPMSLVMWNADEPLTWARQQSEVKSLAVVYLRYLVPGNAAFLLFVVFRQTLLAMSLVWPTVAAMAVANVFNALANYALIFGHFGFPAMGVPGSAIATSASRWVMCLAVLLLARRSLARYWRGFPWYALDPRQHLVQLRLGVPIGLHLSLEMSVFAAVSLMMGSLGAAQLAGHHIALNLASLSFMVPLGIAAAASTRVGNAIGRGEAEAARRSAAVCLVFGASVMACFALLFWLLPGPLSRAYTAEAEVLAVAVLLIPIAAVFQVADGVQVVSAGILRGAADTRVPALIALVGFWCAGMPLALFLGFRIGLGPRGLWWGLTAGLAVVAVLLALRTRVRLAAPVNELQAPSLKGRGGRPVLDAAGAPSD